jgi:SAM-dependent methyltransferase
MGHSTGWYDAHAADLAGRYETIDPAILHGWLSVLFSDAPGTVLDIGAGSGRDAAWFARQGYDVIAVEPSRNMRSEAQRLHPHPRIRWMNDQLPELSILGPLAITFDVVMLTAVWQHVPPSQRDRAFRKLTRLLRSGGMLAISLRSGPSPAGSEMHPVSLEEIYRLARNHGFAVEKVQHSADQQGRTDVSWTNVALRLPDDGTGALPLLRHVILNDQKSATYKLGLLRALCRAADGSAGMVEDRSDESVRVPLGLVALNWLRLYLPLVRERLPQTPTNNGAQGLGFAKEGFQNLLASASAADLRIGARFVLERAHALHAALREAAQTSDRMPSTFMTYPMGGRILPVERGCVRAPPNIIQLDTDYLAGFGWMLVPGHLWRAMRRNAAWIEPTLIAEWMRLMRDYARNQNRSFADEKIFAAMQWSDPDRDVSRAREIALSTLRIGNLHCAWTGRQLSRNTLDIDHMFPWTAWPYFAKEIHKSRALSDMILRQLKEGRSAEISEYLRTNPERFFNSLVVAVYEGDPAWHELAEIRPEGANFDPKDVSEDAVASIGFLSFTGEEKLFALDGQHRLAGIQEALEHDPELADDEASVIFVSHHSDAAGLTRTQRLFTTLNKTARPASKGEIIALDEDDVMAIVARDLVENDNHFSETKSSHPIPIKFAGNRPKPLDNNRKSL